MGRNWGRLARRRTEITHRSVGTGVRKTLVIPCAALSDPFPSRLARFSICDRLRDIFRELSLASKYVETDTSVPFFDLKFCRRNWLVGARTSLRHSDDAIQTCRQKVAPTVAAARSFVRVVQVSFALPPSPIGCRLQSELSRRLDVE